MLISDYLGLTVQRISDFALRVQRDAILNGGPSRPFEGDLAAQLMLASKIILAEAVDPASGSIDYPALKQSADYLHFCKLRNALRDVRLAELGKGSAYTAFWINIYNGLIIDAILQYDLRGSMMRTPGIFRQAAYQIDGMRFSADDIEHGILRRNRPNPVLPIRPFNSQDVRTKYMVEHLDPRIHFALVCGANSCPPIAFYDHQLLETQLEQAAAAFINSNSVRWDPQRRILWLSKIFDWYADDFGGKEDMLAFIKSYTRNAAIRELPTAGGHTIRYLPYDWRINQRVRANSSD